MEPNMPARLAACMPYIGHIQFASVPDRGPPGTGDINFSALFAQISALGYHAPLGAEYRPAGRTEDSLDWLREFQTKKENP